jgi:hypothetical protein
VEEAKEGIHKRTTVEAFWHEAPHKRITTTPTFCHDQARRCQEVF